MFEGTQCLAVCKLSSLSPSWPLQAIWCSAHSQFFLHISISLRISLLIHFAQVLFQHVRIDEVPWWICSAWFLFGCHSRQGSWSISTLPMLFLKFLKALRVYWCCFPLLFINLILSYSFRSQNLERHLHVWHQLDLASLPCEFHYQVLQPWRNSGRKHVVHEDCSSAEQ